MSGVTVNKRVNGYFKDWDYNIGATQSEIIMFKYNAQYLGSKDRYLLELNPLQITWQKDSNGGLQIRSEDNKIAFQVNKKDFPETSGKIFIRIVWGPSMETTYFQYGHAFAPFDIIYTLSGNAGEGTQEWHIMKSIYDAKSLKVTKFVNVTDGHEPIMINDIITSEKFGPLGCYQYEGVSITQGWPGDKEYYVNRRNFRDLPSSRAIKFMIIFLLALIIVILLTHILSHEKTTGGGPKKLYTYS